MAPAHSRSPRSAHPAVSIVHYSYAHPAASIFMRFGGDTHIYPPHYCILEWHPGDWKCRIARIFSKNNRRKSWFPLCRYERKLPSENIPGFISTVSLIFIFFSSDSRHAVLFDLLYSLLHFFRRARSFDRAKFWVWGVSHQEAKYLITPQIYTN